MSYGRRVVTSLDAQQDPRTQEDGYLAKLAKYIPAEIVAVYVFIYGILKTVAEQQLRAPLEWLVFALLLALSPFYYLFVASHPGKSKPWFQATMSTIAYPLWVYAMGGGPFVMLGWYHPAIASVLLALSTLLIPWAEKIYLRSRS